MAKQKKQLKKITKKAGPRTQKTNQKSARISSSVRKNKNKQITPLLIHSLSISRGILMKTQRHAVIALRRPSGDVFVAATKMRPHRHQEDAIVLLPIVRGISFLVELLALYVFAARHNRSVEREYKKIMSPWDRGVSSVQKSIIVLLWVFLSLGLAQFLLMYMTELPVSSAHFVADVVRLFLALIAFTALFGLMSTLTRSESETLSYHIAAQKVLATYERDGEITVSGLERGGYVFDRTLVPLTFWTMFLLVVGLVLFNWQVTSPLMSFVALIGIIGIAFGLAYELVIQAEKRLGLWYLIIIRPFLGLQSVLAHRPANSHLEVALIALMSIRSLEKR